MIKLAKIFQSGMVLQRQKQIKFWGETNIEQDISVRMKDEILTEKFCQKGVFEVFLPAQEAAWNVEITVEGSIDGEVHLHNVDIGEVWIAGGQSNMEMELKFDSHGKETIDHANDEHFRFYHVAQYAFAGEKEDGFKDESFWDVWLPFQQNYAGEFSAVATYFARDLREKYNIPIGIVGCNWGGTSAVTWADKSLLQENEDLKIYIDEYNDAVKDLDMKTYKENNRAGRAAEQKQSTKILLDLLMKGLHPFFQFFILQLSKKLPEHVMGPYDMNRPGGLYEQMVIQIASFTCRGVIWYQGESDENKPHLYGELFTTVIKSWRNAWGEDIPFLFVQLAPFKKWLTAVGDRYPLLRSKQEQVSKEVANTWMASIMDVGMKHDIHPKLKKPVGERLALLAMGKIYGEPILCESPEVTIVEKQNNQLTLTFNHAGSELTVKGKFINSLFVYQQGKNIKISGFIINKNKLILEHKQLKSAKQIKIHFAMEPYCKVNLYNSAGIPAKPFMWVL